MPHIHEKIDFCAEVFIEHNNTVLLRKHDKYNIWLSVGGHIELHEDPNQAAIREVKEEVGLDILLIDTSHFPINDTYKLIPPTWMYRHSITDSHEHIVFVYIGISKTNELMLSETEVADECKWCTKDDLDIMDLEPHIKQCAVYALEITKKKE